MPDLPELLTVNEVAALLRVHKNTLYKWIREGSIESLMVGKTIRFRRDDIERLLAGEPTGSC
jgi:excisionase family DNA binding protein